MEKKLENNELVPVEVSVNKHIFTPSLTALFSELYKIGYYKC